MIPPCKNCITFAICYNIYLEFNLLEGIFITKITRRCSTVQSFIARHSYPFNNGESSGEGANEKEVINFFKEYNE